MTICPLGLIEDEIPNLISACIEEKCGLRCKIIPPRKPPEYAYDRGRLQYNAKLILRRLISQVPRDAFKFMGVAEVDLFVPILQYVFGVAQMEGPCSLISVYRLRPQFYERPPNRALFLERLQKTALHELGHCFGLTHCINRHCVMYSSTRIQDTDSKEIDFCPTCKGLFQWYLEKELENQ